MTDLPTDDEIATWPAEKCWQFLEDCDLPWPDGESDEWDTTDYQEAVMEACAKLAL